MPNLHVFENVTLDGYFTGEDGDLSWAHARGGDDPEWNDFIAGNASGGGTLLLGRKTYEMMKAYWPTPQARREAPEVAAGMNRMKKVVVSRTLDDPGATPRSSRATWPRRCASSRRAATATSPSSAAAASWRSSPRRA